MIQFHSLLLLGLLMAAGAYAQLNYPQIPKSEHHQIYHGTKVSDSYQYLEKLDAQATQQWLKNQDDLLNNYLDKGATYQKIKSHISQLVNLDVYSMPIQRNGKFYFTKVSAQDAKPRIYFQEGQNAQEELLLAPTFPNPDSRIAMTGSSPGISLSKKGKWLTYNIAHNQQRWFEVQIYDLENKTRQEKLRGLHQMGGEPVWWGDQGFFYSRFPSSESKATAQLGNPSIYYHQIGTNQSEDRLMLDENFLGNGWLYSLNISSDEKYLIIHARKGSSSHNQIYYMEIANQSPIQKLISFKEANYTFLGNQKDNFFFYTDLEAPRGRVISLHLSNKNIYQEIIPQTEDVISAGSLTGGNGIGFYGNKFVLKYTHAGEPLIKVFDEKGNFLYSPQLPAGGSLWGGFLGEVDQDLVFYQFLGLIDPSSIYSLNLQTGEAKNFKRSLSLENEDQYLVEKVFVESTGGAKVPMFIARKKGSKANAIQPGFIYGYGAFGWVSFIWYQPHVLTWLEMGGVYAIAGIRGGGEFGKEWHEAGKKLQKQNSIDDYLACSQWLIQNKYVAPNKLVANGGSISAATVAAALNQKPNLYGAAIIDRPALDLLRFPEFTGAKSWIQELGSPAIKEEFEVLYAYSPYHNIQKKCYPPTLVMVGDQDETTPPLHAYKYVAILQEKNECRQHPVLLKIMSGVGHNFGNTSAQKIDSYTDMIMFLKKVLKI